MPRKLINDYTFYKIVNINGDVELCYVGSTVNMKERVRTHRSASNDEKNNAHNFKVYQIIREHGGWCEFRMIEIGEDKQLTSIEARIKEEEYRVELKAELNGQKCFVSDEEKREGKKISGKKYLEKNKEKITQRHKEVVSCECGCILRKRDLARHKQTQKHIKLMEELVTKKK